MVPQRAISHKFFGIPSTWFLLIFAEGRNYISHFRYHSQRIIFWNQYRLNWFVFLIFINFCNDNLAIKFQKEFGFENYSSNWKDLVKNPEIDIIDINTPNYLHYEIAKLAIEEGKHI